MTSGKNGYNNKIETLFTVFRDYRGGGSGKSILVVDKYDRKLFTYPKNINVSKADLLWIKLDYSID